MSVHSDGSSSFRAGSVLIYVLRGHAHVGFIRVDSGTGLNLECARVPDALTVRHAGCGDSVSGWHFHRITHHIVLTEFLNN